MKVARAFMGGGNAPSGSNFDPSAMGGNNSGKVTGSGTGTGANAGAGAGSGAPVTPPTQSGAQQWGIPDYHPAAPAANRFTELTGQLANPGAVDPATTGQAAQLLKLVYEH